ncbi:terminase [Ensifer sp. IC3342]|nr:terminase [Ensifer sp. BRP08]MCA1446966.1 terminase [Ensifer sp. IC3342]
MFIDKQATFAGKSASGLTPELRQLMQRRNVPKKDWNLPSGRAIAFAHSLVVPAGKHVGKPLRLSKPQIEFIRDVYNPRDKDGLRKRRQAIFSVGRRNGKTLLAAVIILLHLVGPFKRPNSVIASAATTRKQAGIVYRFVAKMIRMNTVLMKRLKLVESTKHVTHRRDGSFYSAIAAEAGGQFGEGLDLVVYDELAQAKNAALYDVLMTSLGAQVEPLMMIISTQAPADDHILSELIDYGLKIRAGEIEDDTFTVHLYAADPGCALLDERQWRKANPALGDYRDLDEFRAAMRRAEKVPSLESRLRNLYLNQRVQAKAPFLSPNVWTRGNRELTEDLLYDGRPVYGGLDLSARTDLSALVMAVNDDHGNVQLFPRIWTPGDTIDERGLRDRAPYRVWADRSFLIPVPGQVLDYDFLAADVGELSSKILFAKVNYDQWRIDVLKQSFARMGVLVPLSPFGQGYKSMSPAIEIFEELAVQGRLVHGGHPVLRWCVSNAVVDMDAARNRKLTKAKSFGRIDAGVAAVMAVAACRLQTENELDLDALVA